MLLRILLFISILLIPALSHAETDSAEADFTPWSGYWWPKNKGGLATGVGYDGHPAPLEKYELLKDGSYPGPATQWYLDHNYDPDAPYWYGLCDSWAAASVSENISFYPSIIDNILFKVGDKKGLLTLTHEYDVAIRENSSSPEVFHSWLLTYIKEQGISFYANLDPGDEIWNYPIFRYEMDITDLGDSLSVTVIIWYADDQVEPDYQGTKERAKQYTYILYQNNSGEITGGEWTENSIYDHPQQLNLPITPHSDNPYLDYDFIRSLAETRDDELESDSATPMHPGGYRLLLLNEDQYQFTADAGDTLLLHLEKEEGFENDILTLLITDADGTLVYTNTLGEPVDITVPVVASPYTLSITSDSYESAVVYSLQYDLKKTFEFVNSQIQKGFGWGGFVITNAGDEACESVYVVGYDADNIPLETYLGPFSLAAGEKRTILTDELDVRLLDREQLIGFKVLGSSALQVLNIFGYFDKNMSCYGTKQNRSRFVIPDSSDKWDYSRSVSWGLYNPTVSEQDYTLEFYGADGSMVDTVSTSISVNKSEDFDSTDSPFVGSEDGGWVLVNVEDGKNLQGYTEWLESGVTKAEVLDALSIGKEFFVPQVVDTSTWSQSVVLINADEQVNTVTVDLVGGDTTRSTALELQPYQKKNIKVVSLFPEVPSSQLNLSTMKIVAEQDMAGFFKFITPDDDLYYPLLHSEHIEQEIVLPHVAINEYWWTGCTLFNPSAEDDVLVTIMPYDAEGNLLADQVLEKTLGPLAKDVFTLFSLYGSPSSQFSFVKFQAVSGPGITGVFALGNKDMSMLSGTVMH